MFVFFEKNDALTVGKKNRNICTSTDHKIQIL